MSFAPIKIHSAGSNPASTLQLPSLLTDSPILQLLNIVDPPCQQKFIELIWKNCLMKKLHLSQDVFYKKLYQLKALKQTLMHKFSIDPKAFFSLRPFSNKTLQIDLQNQLAIDQFVKTQTSLLETLMPWRKGPYYGLQMQLLSEWLSNLKWERLKTTFAPKTWAEALEKKTICDIGANNGYFMFQLAALNPSPSMVVGLEPTPRYLKQFDFLQNLAPEKIRKLLCMLPFGYQQLDLFPKSFDMIFAMGILYHHAEPMKILKQIHQSLKPKGSLLIDCQAIPGKEEVCLFPKKTYAKKRGFYFLPSSQALFNWLSRSGFSQITTLFQAPLTPQEQHSVSLAPGDSLLQGLDPLHPQKTQEGYPAPVRIYLKAIK